jgi:glycosyltransferase involved in cell wall biosynthesis
MPRLFMLIAEDWFFISHFLPMARAAQESGYQLTVMARVGAARDQIVARGWDVIPLDLDRGSRSPFKFVDDVLQISRHLRRERPAAIHCVALRMVLVGGIAARLAGVKSVVLAPTGLGHLWSSDTMSARIARWLVRVLVKHYLARPGVHFLFENGDDPQELGLAADAANVTIVPGAGVDPADFPRAPEPPSPPLKVAVVARMIQSKGIVAAVEAVRQLRSQGVAVELDLFGSPDPLNPTSIAEDDLRRWSQEPGITWRGHAADVAGVWRDHHVALFLTSYREGVPRTLIEAAACGRPIVTTDTVGCREVVRDGVEGFLVAKGDVAAAAQAIARLASDADLRHRLGEAARERFLQRFTEAEVRRTASAVYRALPAQP